MTPLVHELRGFSHRGYKICMTLAPCRQNWGKKFMRPSKIPPPPAAAAWTLWVSAVAKYADSINAAWRWLILALPCHVKNTFRENIDECCTADSSGGRAINQRNVGKVMKIDASRVKFLCRLRLTFFKFFYTSVEIGDKGKAVKVMCKMFSEISGCERRH